MLRVQIDRVNIILPFEKCEKKGEKTYVIATEKKTIIISRALDFISYR